MLSPGISAFRFWYRNTRPHSLPQSFLPALFAVSLALHAPGFSWGLALVAVLGVACGHLAANLLDDYFDYRTCRTDYRDTLKHEGFRARVGKCAYLSSGQTTLGRLLAVALGLAGLALALGCVVFYLRGTTVFYFALAAAALSLFYSGPPVRLSYRGLGEFAIGLIFGPLNMLGVYYAACGEMNATLFLLSLAVGLLVMNIVYVHAILDYVPDRKIGKQTLAVRLDSVAAMFTALFLILFLPYGVLGYGLWAGMLARPYGALLVTLPMAGALFHMMLAYVRTPERGFSPRPWMGPMRGWQRIESNGIAWFMIRWFLARNLLAALCLIGIGVNLIA